MLTSHVNLSKLFNIIFDWFTNLLILSLSKINNPPKNLQLIESIRLFIVIKLPGKYFIWLLYFFIDNSYNLLFINSSSEKIWYILKSTHENIDVLKRFEISFRPS
jgi:hypothetical protein